ncbi:unnamed protein product [Ceratitis capitata]|uniref:(Mediterranean fruit fly) hypothetical protein n=1 Tax=Ceratitis capitata TaxID=7213 RepID=A0A811VH78_CERCA|nr:unnamed protein product [Ceratitis capitata]
MSEKIPLTCRNDGTVAAAAAATVVLNALPKAKISKKNNLPHKHHEFHHSFFARQRRRRRTFVGHKKWFGGRNDCAEMRCLLCRRMATAIVMSLSAAQRRSTHVTKVPYEQGGGNELVPLTLRRLSQYKPMGK